MREIARFRSKRELAAEANVQKFVAEWRENTSVFGEPVSFEANRWNVLKRRAVSGTQRLVFSVFACTPNAKGPFMAEPYLSFAKAYVLSLQDERPTTTQAARMNAVRALETALRERHARPAACLITSDVLNAAAELLRSHLVAHSAYSAGNELARLADLLEAQGMVPAPLSWRSPLHRPILERIGPEFDRRRATKLPSAAALGALAEAFNRAAESRDRLVTAIAALDFVAHGRIAEVLTSPLDCDIVTYIDKDQRGVGLRWWPAKGEPPTLKFMLDGFEPIARRALAIIRDLTSQARVIARWYEKNPRSLYLPPDLEHFRSRKFLSLREVEAITGVKHGNNFVAGMRFRIREDSQKEVPFDAVEKKVLGFLPREFPTFDETVGITFSEALFVVQRNMFRNPRRFDPMPCMFERVSPKHVNAGLGNRIRHYPAGGSVFERLGYREDDGSPIEMTTHMIRHYLSDLAQRNGVAPPDLAAWAGRKPRQNAHYCHMSEGERLDRVRRALGGRSTWHGPLAEIVAKVPVDRDEFIAQAVPTAHTTEIGFCIHDFSMMTCQLHLDCVFCTEHICIKGDVKRTETVRRWLQENRTLLAGARQAMSRQDYGSDRWVEHATKAVDRLSELHSLLTDKAIPDGAVIQLTGKNAPSRLREAAEASERCLRGRRNAGLLASSRMKEGQ